jgi:bacterioferritin-associated ferredoxin
MVEVPQLGGIVPLHGPALDTRVPGLFVAGNIVGIEGAPVAAAQGRLAAASALRFLSVIAGAEADREIANAQQDVARARRSLAFRFLPEVEDGHRYVDALWREAPAAAIRAPRSFGTLARSDVLVCRCEEVTQDRVVAAFDDGATAVAGVKKRTRACMGRCQGRVCEDVLRRLADARGLADLPRHRPRIPARPVRLADL